MEQNGGRIEVQSELGKGSCFRVSFPRVEGIAASLRPSPKQRPLGRGDTVRIGEDDVTVRRMAVRVLKRLGYVEGETSSGNIGIEKEIHRFLPEDITVADFEKDFLEGEEDYEDIYLIRYYSDGQSDWFTLKFEGRRGLAVKLENDPISGKIRSKFTQ